MALDADFPQWLEPGDRDWYVQLMEVLTAHPEWRLVYAKGLVVISVGLAGKTATYGWPLAWLVSTNAAGQDNIALTSWAVNPVHSAARAVASWGCRMSSTSLSEFGRRSEEMSSSLKLETSQA